MTPAEVEELADDVYGAFVRFMEREAAEIKRAAARRGRR
jgi:hypothetical protein